MPGVPEVSHRQFTLILLVMMGIITAAYLVFLMGSWETFQQDRAKRDTKLDELLARITALQDTKTEVKPDAQQEV